MPAAATPIATLEFAIFAAAGFVAAMTREPMLSAPPARLFDASPRRATRAVLATTVMTRTPPMLLMIAVHADAVYSAL